MKKAVLQRHVSIQMLFLACVMLRSLPTLLCRFPYCRYSHSGNHGSGNRENTSARELENTAVKPIRRQLCRWEIADIQSETRDGYAIIRLKFDYGTNTDLAFIEVNEKSTPR